jgi:hypothetical protein
VNVTQPSRRWTKTTLIDWCIDYRKANDGRLPTQNIMRYGRHMPSPSTIARHFGSMTACFDAVQVVLDGGEYPPSSLRESPGKPKLLRETMITMGVAYVREMEQYPSARDCAPRYGLPSESAVRRCFGAMPDYYAAIYRADPSLPEPPIPTKFARMNTRPTKYRYHIAPRTPASSASPDFVHGPEWLGGVNLLEEALSGRGCQCEGCETYRNDPARHCVCGDVTQICKACRDYRPPAERFAS